MSKASATPPSDRNAGLSPPTAQPETPAPTEKQAGKEEIGGPEGPEPTRFGDWEKAGRCSDF
ncbi:MAG: DUF1674 domain-containing protein [Magnetospirillum sp.]|nr:DUF1674 domain-containing protein [Magnetospirillum sp.]